MANTYTQIHLQLIFAVKYRLAVINETWENELYKYITGIVQNQNHKLLCINGMPDHIHILIGYRPHQALSDLLREIKGSSSSWINEERLTQKRFKWQEGYAAFSYCRSDLPRVCSYIEKQKSHHQRKKFLVEYKEFLKAFEVEYDERYIFTELV